MLGPRYDDQVAEENRFHPSMLSNYLKSLKVRLNFLLIKTLRSLLMFIHMLLFRFKKKGGWRFPLRHLYRVFFFYVFRFSLQLINFQKYFLIGKNCAKSSSSFTVLKARISLFSVITVASWRDVIVKIQIV